ncbi:hypothetical protein L9F63_006065, partial [Diploptera punctata]
SFSELIVQRIDLDNNRYILRSADGGYCNLKHVSADQPISTPFLLLILQMFNLTLNKCNLCDVRKEASVCDPEEWKHQFWKMYSPKQAEDALFKAAQTGDTTLASWLVDIIGTNVNALNENSLTPLHVAAENGHSEVVQFLLDKKAFLEAQDKWKWVPLHYCAWKGHIKACAALVKAGATLDRQTHDGRTPLHRAADGGFLEIANILLDNGENPNLRDNWEWTPLFYAAWKGHLSMCKLLVDKGVDPKAWSNNKDWKGSPVTWAKKNNHVSVVEYLESKGARI